MYNDYFGLKGAPFSIAPNPAFLYMSDRHREALAHLLYGIRSDGGFVLLTGEVGTGKTTVCRCLLEQIPEDVDTAFILNPKLTANELLATICDDLGIDYSAGASIKVLVDKLNAFLLSSHQQGRRTVLIIDEAQNLSIDVLEQLRLLTNLETNQRKLLQIILLGQPELLDILSRKELRQLSQRVTARFHLDALTKEEVRNYIDHRLEVAGAKGRLFASASIRRIYQLSGGIPRLINLICDRALLGAYAENRLQVDRKLVDRAAREVMGAEGTEPSYAASVAVAFITLLLVGVGAFIYIDRTAPTMEVATTKVESPVVAPPVSVPEPEPEEAAPQSPIVTATSTRTSVPRTDALIDVEGDPDPDTAIETLFALWQLPPANGTCAQAEQFGLRCLVSLGSLRDILHLNRPAAIRLNIAGLNHHVVVVAADSSAIAVRSTAGEWRLSERDVLRSWDGNFVILWRSPPDYRVVKLGNSGPTVDWLIHQLAAFDGEAAQEIGATFDKSLEDRLKRFQISVGLRPDGIAGERTWIHLNGAVDAESPRLTGNAG